MGWGKRRGGSSAWVVTLLWVGLDWDWTFGDDKLSPTGATCRKHVDLLLYNVNVSINFWNRIVIGGDEQFRFNAKTSEYPKFAVGLPTVRLRTLKSVVCSSCIQCSLASLRNSLGSRYGSFFKQYIHVRLQIYLFYWGVPWLYINTAASETVSLVNLWYL